MKTQLMARWDGLRTNFWFLPALMTGMAIALSFGMLAIDRLTASVWLDAVGLTYGGGADGARSLLSTVASTMVTVAGVVFSITIVALQLASSQFGPRLLRNFIRDRGNQFVLGIFVATFVYSLLILRTVRGSDNGGFVPYASITVAVLLTLVSLGVLIYFVHHIAFSIQAPNVIAAVSRELNETISHLFPEELGESDATDDRTTVDRDWERELRRNAQVVRSNSDGYIQGIDGESLLQLATKEDVQIRIERRPGHFVVEESILALIVSSHPLDDGSIEEVRDTFLLGPQRTQLQDAEFAVDQLVEIAVRALSPGVNDPFTAVTCVDRLSGALSRLARRSIPSPYRYDDQGTLRVIAEPVTFEDVLDTAFNQIRQYGRSSVAVMVRLLEAIDEIAGHARRPEDRAALLRHALMIERDSRDAISAPYDRNSIQARYQDIAQRLKQPDSQSLQFRRANRSYRQIS